MNQESLRDLKFIFALFLTLCVVADCSGFFMKGESSMIINKKYESIVFDESDMNFVSKFGIQEATDMVFDYLSTNKTPFIYDVFQLADYLQIKLPKLFRLVNKADELYSNVVIKKRNKSDRILSVPDYYLGSVQKRINRKILSKIDISKYATAYYKGSNLLKNVENHCGKKNILKMDITDFFSSITFGMVLSSCFNTSRFPRNIGYMLTTLCCKDDCLPQGTSTSPAISNIVMKNFDDILGNWCEKRGISYTRYCDDLTFSSDEDLYPVYVKAKSMLNDMGFQVNEKKTHFIKNSNRQEVTGIVVNDHPQLSRDYRRKLRQELYFVFKYGIKDALEHINKKEVSNKEIYSYACQLSSKISYVLFINPNDKEFVSYKQKMNKILKNANFDDDFHRKEFYGWL